MENIFVYSLFNFLLLVANHVTLKQIIESGKKVALVRLELLLVVSHVLMNLVVVIFFAMHDDMQVATVIVNLGFQAFQILKMKQFSPFFD